MNKIVTDTHRLMYRNARIRALDLSDRVSQISFFNVTGADEATDIGTEVFTDQNGYIFYGNAQGVECLTVKQSAIIQVDLNNTNAWDIQWIVEVGDEDSYVAVGDVAKVVDGDGNVIWDPIGGENWQFPDYVKRDELRLGEWAEGTMVVRQDTPEILNIDQWTHSIFITGNMLADHYVFSHELGRYGQVIVVMNETDETISLWASRERATPEVVNIYPNDVFIAAKKVNQGWYFRRATDDSNTEISAAYVKRQILQTEGEWNADSVVKINNNESNAAYRPDYKIQVPPACVALTYNNKFRAVMLTTGELKDSPITEILYQNNGEWSMYANNKIINPSYTNVITIDNDNFPSGYKFGSYNGNNKLKIVAQMVPGTIARIVIKVPQAISTGVYAAFVYLNGIEIYVHSGSLAAGVISGTIECNKDFDTQASWFFWRKDDGYIEQ